MKLYTEEDLIKAIAFGFGVCHKENRAPFNTEMREFIGSLEPTKKIELPSNEEIDVHVEEDFLNSTEVHKYSEETQLLMKAMCKAGALWIRDKIQADNKKVEIVQGGFCTTNVVNN